MTHKHIFVISAVVGILALASAFMILLLAVIIDTMKFGDAIGVFNLLVDIVVGIFTVWGLFWAATEFSAQRMQPEIKLVLGKEENINGAREYYPIYHPPIALLGSMSYLDRELVGDLRIGLFIENIKPRMARYIQLVIIIESFPQVSDILHIEDTFTHKPHDNRTQTKIVLRFDDDLVIYQGEGVFLGVLQMIWRDKTLPSACELQYTVYKAEGRPDTGRLTIDIDWQLASPPNHLGDKQ